MFSNQDNSHDKPSNQFSRKIDPQNFEEYVTVHSNAYLKEMAKIFTCFVAKVGGKKYRHVELAAVLCHGQLIAPHAVRRDNRWRTVQEIA